MLSLTCLHSKNQVCSSFSGACQSKCQPTQLCSTQGRTLSDGYPWSRAQLQQIANDMDSVARQIKGMQYKGASSHMIVTLSYSTVRKWLQELGTWVPSVQSLSCVIRANSQRWLWFTGILPILLLILAAFYQAQKRICISYHSILNYFLNRSEISSFDILVASYWVTL